MAPRWMPSPVVLALEVGDVALEGPPGENVQASARRARARIHP